MAILAVMGLELESRDAQLATKDDLSRELGRFELVLRSSLADFRAEMRSQLSETKDQFGNQLSETKGHFGNQFSELNGALAEMRQETRDRFHSLELQIQTQRADLVRWIVASRGAMIGAFGVMLGLFYFFPHLKPGSP